MRATHPRRWSAAGAAGAALAAVGVLAVPPVPVRSAWAQAEPDDTAAGAGLHLSGSASAGAVYAADPAFLVPYADPFVVSSVTDLSIAGAFAEATPIDPGSAADLVPVVLAVGCPACPPVPAVADVTATARPPASTADGVAVGAASLGPVRTTGPVASADAVVAERASASASTGTLDGATLVPGVSYTSATTTVATTASPFAATSQASIDLGGMTFVALAAAAPEPVAVVGMASDDGSLLAVPADGIAVGDAVLRPSADASPGHARAGAVLQRRGADGTVEEVTVLSAVSDAVAAAMPAGSPASRIAAPAVAVPVRPARGAGATTAVLSFGGARTAPTPSAAAATALPVIRASSAPRFASIGRTRWLVWLFLAWCCLALATSLAGQRWLAPRLAVEDRALRAARAAAADHLDRWGP